MLAESSILYTQKLNEFGWTFLIVLIAVQVLTILGTWKDINWILILSHIAFGVSLILGSLFAQNKYILIMIVSVIVVSSVASICQRRCAYDAHCEELQCSLKHCFAGCFPAELIYGTALVIIAARYYMSDIE